MRQEHVHALRIVPQPRRPQRLPLARPALARILDATPQERRPRAVARVPTTTRTVTTTITAIIIVVVVVAPRAELVGNLPSRVGSPRSRFEVVVGTRAQGRPAGVRAAAAEEARRHIGADPEAAALRTGEAEVEVGGVAECHVGKM